MQAVLSNAQHPENGQITVHFPIPGEGYDSQVEALEALGIGDALRQDCHVVKLTSHYGILERLEGQSVNVDELDYLAKRLDSFCAGEDAQFQAMAHKLYLTDIKDFIDLTFCCQQATVITSFSDLEAIGKSHILTLNGGMMPMDQYQAVDGRKEALQLIQGRQGTITPFGVVYDNGIETGPPCNKLHGERRRSGMSEPRRVRRGEGYGACADEEQVYNGRQFPAYLYERPVMMLEITPKQGLAEGNDPEYLYLPATARQIERTLLRVGVTALSDAQMHLAFDELPDIITGALDLERLSGDDIPGLNRLCRAVQPMTETDMEKLNAVVQMTEASGIDALCQLAENLDLFDFVPGVQTPEEYGKYMIRESGHFEYDENLDGFYDYRRYGEQRIREEGGQFNECGYVAYHGTLTLEELMAGDPAEQYQREQGQQMGLA